MDIVHFDASENIDSMIGKVAKKIEARWKGGRGWFLRIISI